MLNNTIECLGFPFCVNDKFCDHIPVVTGDMVNNIRSYHNSLAVDARTDYICLS